jgi:hypothetical protein
MREELKPKRKKVRYDIEEEENLKFEIDSNQTCMQTEIFGL